jgi:phosphatidyl-myo-inositol dimannoside synthase
MTAPCSVGSLLVLTHEFAPRRGGIAVYIEEVARAAAAAGYAVELWVQGAVPPVAPDGTAWPFEVRHMPGAGNQNWPARLRLARALRTEAGRNWAQTTVWLPEPGPLRMWLYHRLLSLPQPGRLIVTLHGTELEVLARWPHRRWLLGQLLARCARVGVVSSHVAERLRAVYPQLATPVMRVPGAPRSGWALAGAALRAERGPPWTMVCVARIHPRKGQLVLVRALQHLSAVERGQWRLVLVGPVVRDRYWRRVQQAVRSTGCAFEYRGVVDDAELPAVLAAADLAVMPSQPAGASTEGLGLFLLEAAAAGLPVVATDCGGAREALAPGASGWLVPVRDAAALATVLRDIAAQPSELRRRGAYGRQWVATTFSWQSVVAALFE